MPTRCSIAFDLVLQAVDLVLEGRALVGGKLADELAVALLADRHLAGLRIHAYIAPVGLLHLVALGFGGMRGARAKTDEQRNEQDGSAGA